MADSMNEIMNPNQAAEKDPDFPNAPADWRRASAESAARDEGIEIGAEHWEVVAALQKYFAEHPSINVRELHDALDERFHGSGGIKHLYQLFPGGPVAQGCRIAGLEAPAGSSDPSFGSVQ